MQSYAPPFKPKRFNVGSLPFLFAELIFGWVYFTFVVIWIPAQFASGQVKTAIIELLFFHLFFILAQVSFFMTTFTDPGEIPEGFMENHEMEDNVSSSSSTGLIVTVTETKKKGEKRRCNKCSKAKPDRTHHCSACKRCILKMDHHCPWVNNCVGFFNYKFFVLFLSWTVILGVFVAACLVEPCFSDHRDPFLFVTFILGIAFGIGLGLFTITHYAYLFMNQTTIEVMEKKTNLYVGNLYNLGAYRNFTEVFGDNFLLWFVPVYTTKGNGLSFSTKNTPVTYV